MYLHGAYLSQYRLYSITGRSYVGSKLLYLGTCARNDIEIRVNGSIAALAGLKAPRVRQFLGCPRCYHGTRRREIDLSTHIYI